MTVLRAHPWCAALFTGRLTPSGSYLHVVEMTLDILRLLLVGIEAMAAEP